MDLALPTSPANQAISTSVPSGSGCDNARDKARRRHETVIGPQHRGAKSANAIILDTIQSEKVDTLVVGRRGRGRLAGLLLGSVSQKVASLAPCAVTIVP